MAKPDPVASLPMYDWPEVAWADDALWRAIAERLADEGIAAPDALTRTGEAEDVWRDPGLVLSQTCGFPYATRLKDAVQVVATPIYAADGCDGPLYSSVIVAHRESGVAGLADLAGRRFAFNARDSLSGFVAPIEALRQAGIAPTALQWIETGGHRASIRAVAEGQADAAAIDAVCWALATHYEREAVAQLKVIARTPLRPALPFITAAHRNRQETKAIRSALNAALADPNTAEARDALLIEGVKELSADRYTELAALAP